MPHKANMMPLAITFKVFSIYFRQSNSLKHALTSIVGLSDTDSQGTGLAPYMYKLFIIILSLMLHANIWSAEKDNDEFVITYFENEQVPLLINVIKKSYQDIGIEPTFRSVPVMRGLNMVRNGYADADLVRVQAVASKFDDVIFTPTTLVEIDILLLCNKKLSECSPDALEDPTKLVGSYLYDLDTIKSEYNKNYTAKFVKTQDATQLLNLMQRERLKYGLHAVIKDTLPTDLSENYNHVRVLQIKTVHVLSKKHQNILQELDMAITNNLKLLRAPQPDNNPQVESG